MTVFSFVCKRITNVCVVQCRTFSGVREIRKLRLILSHNYIAWFALFLFKKQLITMIPQNVHVTIIYCGLLCIIRYLPLCLFPQDIVIGDEMMK
jgi:hypothetical protein